MKKSLLLILAGNLLTTLSAQTHNWSKINTGYFLDGGIQELAVTDNCVYVYNGNHSRLVASSDLGLTWYAVSLPSDSLQHTYDQIVFANDSIGYVAGYDGSVFSGFGVRAVVKKTNDRGLSWQMMANGMSQVNFLPSEINFFDRYEGIVFGTGTGQVDRYYTSNGGISWTHVPVTVSPPLDMAGVKYSAFTGNHAVVSGVNNHLKIALSQDGGFSWVTKEFPYIVNPSGIRFFNGSNGVVAAGDSIYFTNDGATTFFHTSHFPYANTIRGFDMIDMNKGFFMTANNIYYTSDAGNSWSLSFTDPQLVLSSLKVKGHYAFVSTVYDSLVLKLDLSSLTAGLSDDPAKKQLNVYPNPATNQITIVIPDSDNNAEVTITDELGRVIRNQFLKVSGIVDTHQLNPGIYFIHVSAGANSLTTKFVIAGR